MASDDEAAGSSSQPSQPPQTEGPKPLPELSLVFADSDGRPVVFSLPEGTTTLGRAGDNDLVLSDPSVEPHQVVLIREEERLELRDLFAGETWVNEELRGNGLLQTGDVLRLGKVKLRIMKVAPRRSGGWRRARSGTTRRLIRGVGQAPPRDDAVEMAPGEGLEVEDSHSRHEARMAREQDARRARAVARSRQLSDEIMTLDDFEEILERISLGFIEVFEADRAVTVLFEEDGRNPLLTVERRRDGTDEGTGVAQEIIDRCLQVRSVIRIAGGATGLGGLAAPLLTEGRVLGLLYFERSTVTGQALGMDDVHLMAMLTNLTSLLIAPLVN